MLYDAWNRPIRTQELTKELAAPTLSGIRNIWHEQVAAGLTPSRLANLLRNAADGDHIAFLTLAEEMEERDLHYACEMSKRKLAVSRLPLTVEAASDTPRDIELADAVRDLIRRPGFRSLIKNLLDALGKGYSVCEIIWDRSGSRWKPKQYEWRDPRFFQFDRASSREIRLRDETNLIEGIELAPYKFVRHVPLIKSGIPVRGGLARLAAWSWMCKSYTVKDWMAFAEVFGMPLRIGKYGTSATENEINILKTAVANIGSDAAAVIPESMIIEFQEAAKSQGANEFYLKLADWLDTQVSRGILGQSATTSGTPGKLGNEEAQKEVREDIRDDDAEQLEETLQRDLVVPFIDLNFGPQENYPIIQLRAPKAEDTAALTTALKELVPLGLKVEQSVVRDKLGLPDPGPDVKPEDLLGSAKPAAPPAVPGEALPPRTAVAQNREGDPATMQQQIDHLLAGFTPAQLQAQMATVLKPALTVIQQADDYQGAMEMLATAYPHMSTTLLQEILTRLIFVAELAGRMEAQRD
jgi:phage gp29-like protein